MGSFKKLACALAGIGSAMLVGLVPAVAHASAITVVDNGFERPNISTLYVYNISAPGWTFTGDSGITANNNAFNMTNAPNGNSDNTFSTNGQAAFVQLGDGTKGGSSASQLLSGFIDGQASVSFLIEARSLYAGNPISVYLDNTNLGTYVTATDGVFHSETTNPVPVTAGSHTLWFVGNGVGSNDVTSFIDSVSVSNSAVPEPSMIGMLAVSATAMLGRKRR